MKTRPCVISIIIIFLLGLHLFNFNSAESATTFSQKNTDPKKELIKDLKAKNENEEVGKEDEKPSVDSSVKQKELVEKEKVYFGKRSHALDTNAKKILNETASWLKDNPETILVIEGHGNEYRNSERNLILGELRAGSIKTYLIKQGINEARLRVISYGAERPSRFAKKMGLKNWRVCILVREM